MMRRRALFFLMFLFVFGCSGKGLPEIENTMEVNEISIPTLVPTLTVPAKVKITENYLRTNNNCSLPCYWGLMPGETTMKEAWQFLSGFAKSSTKLGEGYYLMCFEQYCFNFSTQPQNNDLIIVIRGSLDQSLQEFLVNNGVPDKIYLQSNGYRAEDARYMLYMYYGEKGVWAQHIFRNNGLINVEDNYISICTKSDIKAPGFINGSGINMVLWNPTERAIAGEDPVRIFETYGEYSAIKSLRDALWMSEAEFYEIVLSNNNDICFPININEWILLPW